MDPETNALLSLFLTPVQMTFKAQCFGLNGMLVLWLIQEANSMIWS